MLNNSTFVKELKKVKNAKDLSEVLLFTLKDLNVKNADNKNYQKLTFRASKVSCLHREEASDLICFSFEVSTSSTIPFFVLRQNTVSSGIHELKKVFEKIKGSLVLDKVFERKIHLNLTIPTKYLIGFKKLFDKKEALILRKFKILEEQHANARNNLEVEKINAEIAALMTEEKEIHRKIAELIKQGDALKERVLLQSQSKEEAFIEEELKKLNKQLN